jgi:signal peptidase I
MPHESSEFQLAPHPPDSTVSEPTRPQEITAAIGEHPRFASSNDRKIATSIEPLPPSVSAPTNAGPIGLMRVDEQGFAAGSVASPPLPRRHFFPTPARPVRTRSAPRRSHPASDAPWIGRALIAAGKLGLLSFIAYGLMFNFSVVRGSSMSPGIHDGDRILVNHLSYVFQDVQRGDIVVLQYPLDPNLDYIKRVIGLPGDEITVEGDGVFVNGTRLDEPYVSAQDAHSHLVAHVEPDHFFVMGDNRPHSSDSREFGQVPRENLRGKVDVRVWPPSRVGTLH